MDSGIFTEEQILAQNKFLLRFRRKGAEVGLYA